MDEQAGSVKRGHVPRVTKVKNKAAAPVQITAEQILREALERQEAEPKPPKQKITDPEELADYRLRKRKAFEDAIRRQRSNISTWIRYALWEESQRDFERARSIFERAIDEDYRNITVWLKYAEMEMRNKNINHARNLWDRAVTLLPRVAQFWYKYAYMENILGNFAGARQIFERWMKWMPDEQAWNSYIKFELRLGEVERARQIFERFVVCHPTVKSWLKYAKFEEKQGEIERARKVYEKAIEFLAEEANDEKLFIAFAKFEEKCKEYDRARIIYKYALDHIPKQHAQELYKMFMSFEKQYGDRAAIEDVIVGKRRFQYEEEIKINPKNYDVWFDYARLEESNGDIDKIREVYERAIAQVPPATEKRFWRRYIYLWINYALFEELYAKDAERAQEVYKECLKLVPHKIFSFSKLWIMYANFEIRQKNLKAARVIFGNAIGMAPKDKLFQAYIQLEMQLGSFDRCRTLYGKYLECQPANCTAWTKFASLEKDLGEAERCRAIYEMAIAQPLLDMPEVLWKTYIDFEIEEHEYDRVRALFKRLLERTKHVKVWISHAQFEHSIENTQGARDIYEQAFQALKNVEMKEERVLLIESWREFEQKNGDQHTLEMVMKRMPKRIIKRRPIKAPDGMEVGMEEYYDYIFPDEQAAAPNLKILEMAHKWKKQKVDTE
jgi:crooked neck